MSEFGIGISLILATISLFLVVFLSFYGARLKMLKTRFAHDMDMKRLDFEQKKEWEILLSERAQKKVDEEWLKEKEHLRESVDELWKKRNDITPLDMKRVTMLYLVLMGEKGGMDAEKLDAEMQKVRKTFEIVKENLNN